MYLSTLGSLLLLFLILVLDLAYALSYGLLIRDGLKSYSEIELPASVFGPEGVAFDCNGKGPYVGVSDGRILKWQQANRQWTEFAVTSPNRDKNVCDGLTDTSMEPMCGRPLGLKFNSATCDLYIADAYFGLMVVGPGGGVANQLATSADGVPFKFTNALDIDTKTGDVYFTDSSIIFQRRTYLPVILTGERTGRLLKYDPKTKSVDVVLKGLAFPNGVALSKDNSFLVLAESTTFKVLKVQLGEDSSKANNYYVQNFAQLPRSPDNIKRNAKGEFWVALNSLRGRIQGFDSEIGSKKVQLTTDDPVGIKFDEEGKVIEVLDGEHGKELDSVSEVEEYEGVLWVGSSVQPYVGVIEP